MPWLKQNQIMVRAWAPVVLWVAILTFLGTGPALFPRYERALLPILRPARPTPASPSKPPSVPAPKAQSVPPTGQGASVQSEPGSATQYFTRLKHALTLRVSRLWVRVRPLLARVLLNAAVIETLGHFAIYFVFGVLLRRAQGLMEGKIAASTLILSGAGFAALDENLQRLVPSRSASLFDWGTDILGLCCGMLLYGAMSRVAKRVRRF